MQRPSGHLRRLCRAAVRRGLLGLAALAAAGPLWAQAWPERPIRILTPYAPGSSVDVSTRMVAEGLSRRLQQPVIVENRTGGLGMIAMTGLLTAPADGYTLLTDTPAAAMNPFLHEARYNPKTDLAPVAQFVRMPFVIAGSPALGAKDAAGLVALLKRPDSPVNVAVAGTSTGLAGQLFALQAGVRLNEVPYKGAAPAMMAVLKDEAQLIVLDLANLVPHIQSGRMKGFLITGERRADVLRDVPTAAEAGYPQFQAQTWFGMFARAGVSPEVLQRLNRAVQEVMASPEMQTYLQQRGASASTLDAEGFRRFFHAEVDTWASVIRASGVK